LSRVAILSLVLAAALVGCGSATDSVRSDVSNMQNVISTYNDSHPTSLAATGEACQKAYDDLGKSSSILTTKLPAQHQTEEQALRAAYRSARGGFRKCASGASLLNYPMLAAAQQEIAAANLAIRRAQRLAH
jgi:multidrug efflux pump subunit AcrA (membrane-fusion protein)